MRVLFASIGAFGHLYPLMPLALACADAGHDVVVATGPPFLDRLPLPTVASYAGMTISDAFAETRRRHPEAEGPDLAMAMFGDVAAEQVAETLHAVLAERRPDLVVYEAMDTGAAVAASVAGVPAAAFSIGLARFIYPVLDAVTLRHQARHWTDRGLQPPAGPPLAPSFIDPVPLSLRGHGGPDPAEVIPIRTVAWSDGTAGVPEWLARPGVRPRVYVTLGTVSFGAVEVIRRAVDDLAGMDVEVLVAVGPEGDPALLGDLPPRIHVERFVDQPAVLRLVDAAVHHGGTGTVLGALEAGVPQLILPQGADQHHNAELIPRAGAGRALANEEQVPGAIGAAVAALLADGPERAATRALRAEIAAMPAPAGVVDRLVSLAATS